MYILIFLITILIIQIFTYVKILKREKYDPYAYNYNKENPNALIQGELVGGTVYALEPDNAPGLGWIL